MSFHRCGEVGAVGAGFMRLGIATIALDGVADLIPPSQARKHLERVERIRLALLDPCVVMVGSCAVIQPAELRSSVVPPGLQDGDDVVVHRINESVLMGDTP